MLKIGGLPAKARAIVHDLAIDLAGCEVDKAQDFPQATDRPRFLLLPRKLLIMRAKALRWIFGCNNGLYHSRAPQALLPPLPFKAQGALRASASGQRNIHHAHTHSRRAGLTIGNWAC